MLTFISRRLGLALLTYALIVIVVFVLARVIGDPAELALPIGSSQADLAAFRHQYGFDRPIPEQFVTFVGGLLVGNLGMSTSHAPVSALLAAYLPRTAWLAGVAIVVAVVLGITLGLVSTINRGAASRAVRVVMFVCVSVPEFWIGLICITVFAVKLGWLPTSGYGPAQIVLPAFALMLRPMGRIAETTRAALTDQLSAEYVFIGFANGLRRRTIVMRHALRNALPAIVTLSADSLATLIGGSVTIEVVFAWPGTGFLSIQAVDQRDPQLLVGVVLVVAAFVLLLNLLVDILYGVIDPRIRLRGAN